MLRRPFFSRDHRGLIGGVGLTKWQMQYDTGHNPWQPLETSAFGSILQAVWLKPKPHYAGVRQWLIQANVTAKTQVQPCVTIGCTRRGGSLTGNSLIAEYLATVISTRIIGLECSLVVTVLDSAPDHRQS